MKTPLLYAMLLVLPISLAAQSKSHSTSVHSYTKKSGTTVQSYHRSNANSTQKDNYSAKGNTNPYTGKKGYKTAKK